MKLIDSLLNSFNIRLLNPSVLSFYVPQIDLPVATTERLICYDSRKAGRLKLWINDPLLI